MSYFKEFEIRWSDVDANRHLANSAYVNYMAHTRMSYLNDLGFTHNNLEEHSIGPVVLYEHIYYFKEVFPGKPLKVSLEFAGMSEGGTFFEFRHDFYDHTGRNVARCEMMGGFIDLKTRKLTALPPQLLVMFNGGDKAEGFRVLSREDTRKYAKRPKDLA